LVLRAAECAGRPGNEDRRAARRSREPRGDGRFRGPARRERARVALRGAEAARGIRIALPRARHGGAARRRHRGLTMPQSKWREECEKLELADAAGTLLDECRTVLPGIQALFGFLLVASMVPLALGLCIDLYVIATLILD